TQEAMRRNLNVSGGETMKSRSIIKYGRRPTTCRATLLLLFFLSACGGGGGGGGAAPAPTPLAARTFTKVFAPASAGSNTYPFYTGDVKNQSLYVASEINGAGDIKTLRFEFNGPNAGSVTCPNTTIKLGHTNLTALGATFA